MQITCKDISHFHLLQVRIGWFQNNTVFDIFLPALSHGFPLLSKLSLGKWTFLYVLQLPRLATDVLHGQTKEKTISIVDINFLLLWF